MAALTRPGACLVLLALALAGNGHSQEGGQAAPGPDAPAAPAPQERAAPAAAEIARAEAAVGEAEYEKARESAEAGLAVLDALPDRGPAKERARLLELLAFAHYGVGRKAEAGRTLEQLLAVAPAYRVDASVTGPKFAELLEQLRAKHVGTLEVQCAPAQCEAVGLGAAVYPVPRDGRVLVPAGTHRVTLRRRNFETKDLGELAVPPGQVVRAEAGLEQTARDLRLTTRPAGAKVTLDGRDAGVTEPGPDPSGPSRPLVVEGLPPGPHALVVQAPCSRRLEQGIDIVLDAQDAGAQELGEIRLEKSVAQVRIDWAGGGTLAVDGREVEPGLVEVCPGPHEVSLSVAGRRVWLQTVSPAEDETVQLAPAPRPTLALAGGAGTGTEGVPAAIVPKGFNVTSVADAPAAALRARLAPALEAGTPVYPAVRRAALAGIGEAARAAAPEADLLALVLPAPDALRRTRVLALVDTRRDLVELTGWPEAGGGPLESLTRALETPLSSGVPFLGFDVADRAGRPPVVATVLPGGPAAKAGLAPGQVLLGAGGEGVASAAELAERAARWEPGTAVTLTVADEEDEREVELTPLAAVPAPNPAVLQAEQGLLLLPLLARAEVLRVAGAARERIAAGIFLGLGLAAMDADVEAAAALDRATFDDAFDPAGDARGTVAFVHERLLRKLERLDYAGEVRARWIDLTQARLGGRDGPPLAWGAATVATSAPASAAR